jgi:hypothetical protein
MRTLLIGFFVASVLATAAHGQDMHEHDGFWIGFGLGGGWNVSDGLDGESLPGTGGYFRLGGTPSQKVLLGFEGSGWARARFDEVLTRGNGMFIVMLYPSENGGFFLKGGVGGASVTRIRTFGTVTVESGFGASAGIGFDVRLGNNIYLTPNFDWLFQAFDAGLAGGSNTNSIVLFTLGLTWH